ncbi:MAG: hypothetical protein EBS98_02015 [Chitinophagia bacterium]|nr:hypothetical protein [Chitinophagia bacterium]
MNSKTLLLLVAALLIAIGWFKPSMPMLDNSGYSSSTVNVVKPSNKELLDECDSVIRALRNGPSSRKVDGKRLASLYLDLATLISLDGEDCVIKNTEEIRQANRLAGIMLKLDMKDKYENLAKANTDLIKAAIGDDSVLLDDGLREKAVEGFNALAWASYEGSK